MSARLECDRCDRAVDLTTDEFDGLVRDFPELEVEPGLLYARCPSWPDALHRKATTATGGGK